MKHIFDAELVSESPHREIFSSTATSAERSVCVWTFFAIGKGENGVGEDMRIRI